ncbi:serine/threonine-protein kinase [Sorangium sp. So ce269]
MAPHASGASVAEALARVRPRDPAGLLLAQARIAGALFGADAPGGLGRFRVLERLGAGAMGVVYAAYDPDLDRSVALKLVHVPARGREAALAEAKALARLSHPNVVPVHDAGIERDHVYIVMELVRGETLRRWVKGRDRREILRAYRQAGEALAAAHAAGLVHRDFKPDNAIMGTDGRVRVVDFGLACEAADPGHLAGERQPVAGTPRYMAPEQAAGAPVTPAADQYSFCVALAESLADAGGAGERSPAPVPRWLGAVIERGRAPDPAARFAAMRDLLHALARDPAQIWRRRAAVAALGLGGVAAFFAGRARPAAPGEVCTGGEAELAAAWSPEARAAALARIAGLGPYGRGLAPRLQEALQDHAARWAAGHREACLAHRRGAQSGALLDRRMACLERGRAALAAVAEIATPADAAALPDVVLAVRALPDPASCADLDALLAGVEPPPPALSARVAELRGKLERARVQIAAGRSSEARAVAAPCVAEARALGYRPLLADALLVEGQAAMEMDELPAALPALAEASTVALAAGADAVAIEAWARRAWVQGTAGDPAGALGGLELVEALAARTPSARFGRALLYNNVGSVELARDQRDRARAAFERSLAESRGVTGAGAVELLAARVNLALVTDDPARRDALLADVGAELARWLGDDHPETLRIPWLRATTAIVKLATAAELLTPTCQRDELHEALASRAARCWAEVAYIARELGQGARAVAAAERAVRFGAADDPELPEVVPYLSLWRGDAAAAATRFAEAIAALPPQPDEPSWRRLKRAELRLGLGRARRAIGELRGARQALEPSVADLAAIAAEHPAAILDRRLGRARAELAVTLAASGASAAGVAPVAAAAAAWLRQAEGRAEEIAELERLARGR